MGKQDWKALKYYSDKAIVLTQDDKSWFLLQNETNHFTGKFYFFIIIIFTTDAKNIFFLITIY